MGDNTLKKQFITETLEENYMPYAMSVIVSRAIPEIDGLKPSHRKLLYTMYKMGLLNGGRTKSANVVGQTMRLNPHGDMAIYETMVRLTVGNGSLLIPLVDSKGNFGKQFSRDMAFAASRYTEVKLTSICEEIFGEIDKNTVQFVDNYDSTTKEPVLLPTRFPNILVNPNQGIAVGMASNICGFNLKEICECTIKLLKNKRIQIEDEILAPDFPHGGEIVYNKALFKEIFETGRGSFKVRGKYEYDKKNNCINIYEIPYTTTIEAIIEKIVELSKAGQIKEIVDIRDETDLKGLKITIDLKRGANPDELMGWLYKKTPLEDSFGCNFNILINGEPRVMGVREILTEWIKFRVECVGNKLDWEIKKATSRLHLLEGLEKILLDIDKAVKIIRETDNESDVVPNLMRGFEIDNIQAEFVAEIKLRNLNKEYILKRTRDIKSLIDEISNKKSILEDESKIKGEIAKELQDIINKYGGERKTTIIDEEEIEEVSLERKVDDYNLSFFTTKDGYIKKISAVSLRGASEQKLKEGDAINWSCEATNLSEVIVFTNQASCYKAKAYDIPDTKASAFGEYLPALLSMDDGEEPIYTVATLDFKGFLLFCFENGKIAKIPLESYQTKTNRKKLAGAFADKSKLVSIIYLREDADLYARSSNNKVLVFNSSQLSLKTTRSSQGVNVISLRKGATLDKVELLAENTFADSNYYKTKNIPASGCFIKNEDANGSFV
ncbi:DNA gyrase subunit A [Treponema sp. R6D11]